jgi:3-isopropylmalate dehydrogenase
MMKFLVLPGDGIGPEITAATLTVMRATSQRFDLDISLTEEDVGHTSLRRFGTTVRRELLEEADRADGLILGPTATFDFKDEAHGEINPSMFFRKNLDLFANVRPSRTYSGFTGPIGEFDLVVVRENTEGFYADRNMESGSSEMLVTPEVVVSLRRITKKCCERIAYHAFKLAQGRRKHVTIVHKANVLKIGDGMFIEECHKIAAEFPYVVVDDFIVDAMMAHMVRNPRRFDVIVTTNMFGDILSDLTAELSGSLGLGGSLNAGSHKAMAQASHGCAPDIAGRDIANPFSLILSVCLLLDWLGRVKGHKGAEAAAAAIEASVAAAVANGDVTRDLGGNLGTAATADRLAGKILSFA